MKRYPFLENVRMIPCEWGFLKLVFLSATPEYSCVIREDFVGNGAVFLEYECRYLWSS